MAIEMEWLVRFSKFLKFWRYNILPLDEEKLRKIENYLEKFELTLDRARYHDQNTIRIEVLPDEMNVILENRVDIVNFIKKQGFKYVSLDLEGYRTGSMNEEIGGSKK